MTAGHRALPHTADLIVEAWAPTREDCLAEAVRALVDAVTDATGAPATRQHRFRLPAGPDADLLLGVLDEAIYLLDAFGAVPVTVSVRAAPGGGVDAGFGLADLAATRPHGSAPKGVSLSGLRLADDAGTWRARATVDV